MTKFNTIGAMALIAQSFALVSLISLASSLAAPTVSLYLSEASGVIDLNWDSAPQNLQQQLEQLGMSVESASHGQPKLATGASTPAAYVIPVQNGHTFYSSAEDMQEVAKYVAAGGLVVLLDAAHGAGAATRDFVSQALGYQGEFCSLRRQQPVVRAAPTGKLHDTPSYELPLARVRLQFHPLLISSFFVPTCGPSL